MSWPTLQLEHLGAALVANWLGAGWIFWSRGQKSTAPGATRDTSWHWLAGASLLGVVELISWIALAESRFAAWPEWPNQAFAALIAARGAMSALAAAGWGGRVLSRRASWIILGASGGLGAGFPPIAAAGVGAGWLAAALAVLAGKSRGVEGVYRVIVGLALVVLAVSEAATPALTHLVLQLPSEQPPRWGSRELVTLSLTASAALVAGLAIWLSDRPRRRLLLVPCAIGAAVIYAVADAEARDHAAARAHVWEALANLTHDLPPVTEAAAASIAQANSAFLGGLPPFRLRLWELRDGIAVSYPTTVGVEKAAAWPKLTTPSEARPQPDLPLRVAADRFETGPFFVGPERWMALNVAVRDPASTTARAWLEAALPDNLWKQHLRDPRGPAVIGLLYLAGLALLVLGGRTWIEHSHALHEQAAASAASARAKNEMAGLVSHEPRTPLQIVLGHLELLRSTTIPPNAERSLRIIDGQCRQLLQLVNDTLDLCALEAGRLARRPAAVSPAEIAAAVVRDLRALADQRGLFLELKLSPTLPAFIETDPGRVRQILTNLVANALKYTLYGGVVVRAEPAPFQPGHLVFTVLDSGPGLPAATLARLGEAFQSAESGQSTGLGLALVRRLCAHLGGECTLRSVPEGGCEATVRLPAPEVGPPPAPTLAALSAEVRPLSDIRFVVAEDNALVRELLVTHLRACGANVEEFGDGAAALARCLESPPRIVILDLAMPGLGGRTIARVLRQRGGADSLSIIGLSAESLEEAQMHEAGFDRFFVKPVSLPELTAALAAFLPAAPPVVAEPPGKMRLREIFSREATGQLSALRRAVAEGARDEVARLAHHLQGSAYALADEVFREACAELRLWAETPSDSASPAALFAAVEGHILRQLKGPAPIP